MEKDLYCSLCKDYLQSVELNLNTLKSTLSTTPLISFIEKVVGTLDKSHHNICLQCHDLLNELEAIELRQQEIYNLLKMYIERDRPNILYSDHKRVTESKDLSNMEYSAVSDISDVNLVPLKDSINNELPTGMSRTTNEEKEITDTEVTNTSGGQTDTEIKYFEISSESTAKITGIEKKYLDVIKPHKCKCSKAFRTLWELNSHMNSHMDYQRFICHICGLSYKHQTAFSRHMDAHNGINPFTCIYCNKSFTQKGALVRHVPLHTGEKPYQCDKCGKRFVHHTSFNMHRLSHTGEKSHKCNICGLALMSASHLKRHMRIHTGEKKFACNTCGKRFAERYNLVAHEKLHSNPKSNLSISTHCRKQSSKEKKMKWLNETQH